MWTEKINNLCLCQWACKLVPMWALSHMRNKSALINNKPHAKGSYKGICKSYAKDKDKDKIKTALQLQMHKCQSEGTNTSLSHSLQHCTGTLLTHLQFAVHWDSRSC